MVIKVDESQKALNLFELNECESISDGDNFLGIYADAVNLNEKA